MKITYVILLAVAATLTQTVATHALWFSSSVGWIGPILPACVTVCLALYSRSAVDAALAGWILGFALELPLAGETLGVLSLLFAAAGAIIFMARDAFFRERVLTQAMLGFLFCLGVFEISVLYSRVALPGSARSAGAAALQVLLVAIYTGVFTPIICAGLRPLHHWFWPAAVERR
jgi:hypothetical protein